MYFLRMNLCTASLTYLSGKYINSESAKHHVSMIDTEGHAGRERYGWLDQELFLFVWVTQAYRLNY